MEGFGSRAVASITGLTQRQIDYWDKTHFIKPTLATSSGRGTRRLYNFVDLVQFRVAASLKEKGISLQKMRKCLTYLRKNESRLANPLAALRFITDGDSIFVLTADSKRVLDALKKRQFVFSFAIGPMLQELAAKVKEFGKRKNFTVQVGKKRYPVVVRTDLEDGGYWVECPELPGCLSQGETLEETLSMIRDSIRGHLAVKEKSSLRRKAV